MSTVEKWPPGSNALSDEVDGILIRSQPIECPLERLSISEGAIRYVPGHYRRYYIDLTLSLDQYLAKFSSKSRSTLKRKIKKFAEASGGEIDCREYRTPNEMKTFYPLARQLSRRTYQERLLDAGLPDTGEFEQRMLEQANSNAARAYLLFYKAQPIAYMYCPVKDGTLLYEYLGYDRDYSKSSPSTILQWLVVKNLLKEGGFRLFDFTEGEGSHKVFFSTNNQLCSDIYFFRTSVSNLIRVSLHMALDLVSKWSVKFVEKLGVKSRLKKFLRSL